MARLTKKEILAGIRGKLNSMTFEHSGDRETDIMMAGNQVLRENNVEYRRGMLRPALEILLAPRTITERAFKLPKWSQSLVHCRAYCQHFELHKRFNPPILQVTHNEYTYYVNGESDPIPAEKPEVTALIARHRAENERIAAENAALLKAQRDAIRREKSAEKPIRHEVKPSLQSAGIGRMVKTRWFHQRPPVLALAVNGGIR